MPAFPGIGLVKMTADEGEIVVPKITVTFADGTMQEVSSAELFGDDFFPPLLPSKYFTVGRGPDKKGPLPEDAKAFLASRLKKLFAGRGVASVTFQALRESFPLDHSEKRTVIGVEDERVIPFSS
jgi:hypothetical protein